MLGAIAGDIIGSPYESPRIRKKTKEFPLFSDRSRFTDDTVLTVATAAAIINKCGYGAAYKKWGNKYPSAGYGGSFRKWLSKEKVEPYNSWGNGSAMRVSPVGWAFKTLERTLKEAKASAKVSHNHPEGIKGAQATACAVFMSRKCNSKKEIKNYIEEKFDYNLSATTDKIRPNYSFKVSCQGSVPEAIIAFLDSKNLEDAIRTAVSLGGDADTQAAISGSIAEAYYKNIPESIKKEILKRLDKDILKVIESFSQETDYGIF